MRLIITLMFLVAPFATTQAGGESSTENPPNILWIVAEDISPWMSAYGDDTVATPTFDRMADEGVVLMKTFSPNPICSPTRSALMTGRFPTSDGVHNHRRSRDGKGRDAIYLPEGNLTLPEIFQANGYETFNIGKDDYNFVYDRKALYSAGPDGVPGHIGELKGPSFDWTALAAGKPFFGQIQLRGGKGQSKTKYEIDASAITLPPYYPDVPVFRENWEGHYHNIAKTDREVAEILEKLELTGEADNTAVFFISDHGMLMIRHKQFLYDGGIHVPIFITYPNGIDQIRKYGARREELISLIDLSAAALELAGIPIPEYFEARGLFGDTIEPRSYVPLSRDRADYTFDQIRGIRTDRYKYLRNKYPDVAYMQPSYRDEKPMTLEYRSLKEAGKLTDAQALFIADTRPAEELYDLKTDPDEIHNLADDPTYAETLAKLSATLDSWIATTGDKGQVEETDIEIAAVVARWGELCVDVRCVQYREEYGDEEPSGASGVIKEGL